MGSTWANNVQMEKIFPAWFNEPGRLRSAEEQSYLRHYSALQQFLNVSRTHISDPAALARLEELEHRLSDKAREHGSLLPGSEEAAERVVLLFQTWLRELLEVVEIWARDLMNDVLNEEIAELVLEVVRLLLRWEWGTVKNFLYRYKEIPLPEYLQSKQTINLIDAGLYINVAFPPFLGKKRDLDLIIVQDYSTGEVFKTLTLARDYAAKVNKPFPELDDELLEAERDWPRACYVFDGKNKAPTIVYMPLFNRQNCKDAEDCRRLMVTYDTFQISYTPEMIQNLLDMARANVRNNRETLLTEVHKALERRKSKTKK